MALSITGSRFSLISIVLIFPGVPKFDYGLPKGIGTKRNMPVSTSVVTLLSALLLRLMSVPTRTICGLRV